MMNLSSFFLLAFCVGVILADNPPSEATIPFNRSISISACSKQTFSNLTSMIDFFTAWYDVNISEQGPIIFPCIHALIASPTNAQLQSKPQKTLNLYGGVVNIECASKEPVWECSGLCMLWNTTNITSSYMYHSLNVTGCSFRGPVYEGLIKVLTDKKRCDLVVFANSLRMEGRDDANLLPSSESTSEKSALLFVDNARLMYLTDSMFLEGTESGCIHIHKTDLFFGESITAVNCTSWRSGASLNIDNNKTIILRNSVFRNGRVESEDMSNDRGGCLVFWLLDYFEDIVIDNITVQNCQMNSFNAGGCASMSGNRSLAITNSKFENCTAKMFGGGLHATATRVTLENVTVKDCRASLHGAGLFLYVTSEIFLSMYVFVKNVLVKNALSASYPCAAFATTHHKGDRPIFIRSDLINVSLEDCGILRQAQAPLLRNDTHIDKGMSNLMCELDKNTYFDFQDPLVIQKVVTPNTTSNITSNKTSTTNQRNSTQRSLASVGALVTTASIVTAVVSLATGQNSLGTASISVNARNVMNCNDKLNTTLSLTYATHPTRIHLGDGPLAEY
eukprot:PhF_6_TR27197/c0_g1_i2/m.39973